MDVGLVIGIFLLACSCSDTRQMKDSCRTQADRVAFVAVRIAFNVVGSILVASALS